MHHYTRFLWMIATSSALMFILTYLTTYTADHVFFSETRFYMAFVMGAAMAVVMLTFMREMYKNKLANLAIYAGSILLFVVALALVRSQATVDDVSYMRAMIPHHSIAILTSERANIQDVRVQALADGILKTQRKEIEEMKWLLHDIERHGLADTPEKAAQRPVAESDGAL